MLSTPMDILVQFPIRKSKAQKQAFRDAVQAYAQSLGYPVTVEKGGMGVHNLLIGDPETANFLITAHYDTCARMLLPNLVTPCNALLFWCYQILIVLSLFLATFLITGTICLLFGTTEIASPVALVIYWLLLLLMMVGPANRSNVNDNTSGVVTLLEIARSLPEMHRNKVCFVLFDLEEAGLLGSSAYRKKHKSETDRQTVINLDCVGDGDHILLFPTKPLKKDRKKLAPIYKCCGYFGDKSILVRDKGFGFYPSDQMAFPYGIGVGAFHVKKNVGHFYSRIHTPRDTVLDQTNVNLLRAAIATLIVGSAAQ